MQASFDIKVENEIANLLLTTTTPSLLNRNPAFTWIFCLRIGLLCRFGLLCFLTQTLSSLHSGAKHSAVTNSSLRMRYPGCLSVMAEGRCGLNKLSFLVAVL